MDVIGIRVVHRDFGIGKIADISDGYIKVSFCENKNNLRPFKFPDAFFQRFLSTDNEKLLSYLKDTREQQISRTCSICNTQSDSIVVVDDKRYCADCANQKFDKCYRCGCFCASPQKYYWTNFCTECYKEVMFICDQCKDEYYIDDQSKSSLFSDRKVCTRCADYLSSQCNGCEKIFLLADLIVIDNGRPYQRSLYCSQCIDKHTFICPCCGRKSSKTKMHEKHQTLCLECGMISEYRNKMSEIDFLNHRCHIVSYNDLKQYGGTIQIMNRFRNPKETPIEYLIIKNFSFDKDYCRAHLIVEKEFDKGNCKSYANSLYFSSCTMTELRMQKCSSLIDAIRRETEKSFSGAFNNEYVYTIWEKPYRLNAQTSGDRCYGNYYSGEELVSEGNYYGDTSPFNIIGYAINRR